MHEVMLIFIREEEERSKIKHHLEKLRHPFHDPHKLHKLHHSFTLIHRTSPTTTLSKITLKKEPNTQNSLLSLNSQMLCSLKMTYSGIGTHS